MDIAVYLGQILKNLQKKVLIADLTESFGLYYLFSVSEKFPITYGGVDYVGKQFQAYAAENDGYDIIILCMEGNVRQISGNRLSMIYYISNTKYSNFLSMINEVKKAKKVTGIIVRDITESGITVPYLLKFVFMDDFLIRLYQQNRFYSIRDDFADREYEISMQYGYFGEFKNLSADFLKALEEMTVEISGCLNKEVKLALKYAKEGKNIEKHNILEQHTGKMRNKWKCAGS